MGKEIQTGGTWKVNNTEPEYIGELYTNDEFGSIVIEIHISNSGRPLSYLEIPYNIAFISGCTSSGAKITLIDCKRIKTESRFLSEDIFSYAAKFMVNGFSFEKTSDITFDQVRFRLSNTFEWGGIKKYDYCYDADTEFHLISRIQTPTVLLSNDNFEISYMLYSSKDSSSYNPEEVVFSQEPNIRVKVNTPQPIDIFVRKLKGIVQIIEFATGRKIDIREIHAEIPLLFREIKDKHYPIELEILHYFPHKDSYPHLQSYDFLFNMNDLLNNANLSEWYNKNSLLEPIFELYIEDLRSQDLSLSRRFLNIVQALETYHSRMICNGSLKDYKARVSIILNDVPEEIKERHEKLYLGDSSKTITLKARIYDLLCANFEINLDTGKINKNDFSQVITDTRNYLTHYNQRKHDRALSGQALGYAYQSLKNMLEYYLLKELGFSAEYVNDTIHKRQNRLRTARDIKASDI